MTKSVIVIGNSHVAALRRGWDIIQDQHDVDLDFFAANSTLYGQLTMNAEKSFGMHDIAEYHPKHVTFLKEQFGGVTVDLAKFDAVVLVGTGIREKDFVRNMSRFSVDGIREIQGLPALSQDAFFAFAAGICDKFKLSDEWAIGEGTKTYLLAPPVPLEGCPEDSEIYGVWANYERTPFLNREFLHIYHNIVREKLSKQNVDLITAPWSVQAPSGLTKPQYGSTARRLDEKLANYEEDHHHMDENYGAEVLGHVLKTVLDGSVRQ